MIRTASNLAKSIMPDCESDESDFIAAGCRLSKDTIKREIRRIVAPSRSGDDEELQARIPGTIAPFVKRNVLRHVCVSWTHA
jgi:hypothetical protein